MVNFPNFYIVQDEITVDKHFGHGPVANSSRQRPHCGYALTACSLAAVEIRRSTHRGSRTVSAESNNGQQRSPCGFMPTATSTAAEEIHGPPQLTRRHSGEERAERKDNHQQTPCGFMPIATSIAAEEIRGSLQRINSGLPVGLCGLQRA
ncbi:hypothetical protein ABVT39_002799 [Epinephelus coioides]